MTNSLEKGPYAIPFVVDEHVVDDLTVWIRPLQKYSLQLPDTHERNQGAEVSFHPTPTPPATTAACDLSEDEITLTSRED